MYSGNGLLPDTISLLAEMTFLQPLTLFSHLEPYETLSIYNKAGEVFFCRIPTSFTTVGRVTMPELGIFPHLKLIHDFS